MRKPCKKRENSTPSWTLLHFLTPDSWLESLPWPPLVTGCGLGTVRLSKPFPPPSCFQSYCLSQRWRQSWRVSRLICMCLTFLLHKIGPWQYQTMWMRGSKERKHLSQNAAQSERSGNYSYYKVLHHGILTIPPPRHIFCWQLPMRGNNYGTRRQNLTLVSPISENNHQSISPSRKALVTDSQA